MIKNQMIEFLSFSNLGFIQVKIDIEKIGFRKQKEIHNLFK